MRKLKLDDATLKRTLDELDASDGALGARTPSGQYSYRVRALRLDVELSRDLTVTHVVPSRTISRDGIRCLVGNLVHSGCRCRIHLITVRNNWQTVAGTVAACRYIQGTACVHEVYVRFDRPIDPASFAPTAIRSRILIVDDSAMARRLLGHLLESMNVQISSVDSGPEAIRLALSEAFDLVLMDIEMPGVSGLDAVRILRGRGYIRPIVAVTSLAGEEDRARCLAAGCDDFIVKPPQRDILAAVVQRTKPEPLVSALLHEPDMVPLIDEFVSGLARTILQLEAAYGTQDLEALARLVRTLKGEAGGFGFEIITTAAADLEAAIKNGAPSDDIRNRLSVLIRYCLAARPATSLPDPASAADGDKQPDKPADAPAVAPDSAVEMAGAA